MEMTHLTAGPARIPLAEIGIRFSRSGGPGGQNVNKVETRVEVRFRPGASAALSPEQRSRVLAALATRLTAAGEIVVVSSRTRHRERNRADALGRLAVLLGAALRPPRRRVKTKPTRASREHRLDVKRRRSTRKSDRRRPAED